MERIILRELCFNNKKIIFNEGENYIIGANGAGKTTLFYLIQYILGIKNSMPRIIESFASDNLSLKVNFGNKLVCIVRNFGSNDISFYGDIQREVKASSIFLGEIYNDLLKPNIGKDEDRMIGIEMLKVAFCGEINSQSLRIASNIFNKIIGINVELPIQIKNEIDKFNQEIKAEETTNYVLESYISRVESALRKDVNNKLKDIEIGYVMEALTKEFEIMRKESLQNRLLLEDAKDSLKKVNLHNQGLMIERTKIINSYFYKLISNFKLVNTVDINEAFYNKNPTLSFSENMLLRNVAFITLCRVSENDWHNGSGVLVNDVGISMLDKDTIDKYRKIISEECQNGKLQYIGFECDKKSIPSKNIVLELNHRGI